MPGPGVVLGLPPGDGVCPGDCDADDDSVGDSASDGGSSSCAPSSSSRSNSTISEPSRAVPVYWPQIFAGAPPPLIRGSPSAPYSGFCAPVTGSWPITATTVASCGV